MFQNKLFARFSRPYYLLFTARWLGISVLVGTLAGSASALFLYLLELATQWRQMNPWIIALLPLGGVLIAAAYHYWGQEVVKGNNNCWKKWRTPKRSSP